VLVRAVSRARATCATHLTVALAVAGTSLALAGGLVALSDDPQSMPVRQQAAAPAVQPSGESGLGGATGDVAPTTSDLAGGGPAPAAAPPGPSHPATAPQQSGTIADPVITSTPAWAVAPVSSVRVTPIRPGTLTTYASPGGPRLTQLDNPLYENVPLVLSQIGPQVGQWIPVSMPIRPDNTVGWVQARKVQTTPLTYSIDVYRSRNTIMVWQGQRIVRSYATATGAPRTPTPLGTFHVLGTEPSFGAYGPYVTFTSGFSEVFTTFGHNGGDAVTAMHGTDVDHSVGRNVSNGCLRVHNANADWLGRNITPGTLVRIHP
jgi:lipoprotein-anchoring transpeptidase ErfK/SrfK